MILWRGEMSPGGLPTRSKSRTPVRVRSVNKKGLGDQLEIALRKIGVTKESYVAAKSLFGLPPECGCEKRKRWLNKVSTWWRTQIDEGGTQE